MKLTVNGENVAKCRLHISVARRGWQR